MKIRNGFVSNSSSSSFVCNRQITPEEAKSHLKDLLDCYNRLTGKDLVYDNVFGEIFYSDRGYADELKRNHPDSGNLEEIDGKLIIPSANDNSIPWELVDFISAVFDAERIHLG